MTGMFPGGLPASTAAYALLYVVTLAVHIALISYVLAGSGVVAAAALAGPRRARAIAPAVEVLRDWLPFSLGAAITAGVAPLLFVQLLYQDSFYTANLLLFVRWLAVVPVVMAGFYLLYAGKVRPPAPGRSALATAAAVGAFVCFAFTAWSWAENHLLSLERDMWPAFYASGRAFHFTAEIPLRVAMWTAGAVPIMACAVSWQLVDRGGGESAARPLGLAGLAGAVAAAVLAACYPQARAAALLPAAWPYALAAAAGLGVGAVAAAVQLARGRFDGRILAVASIGLGVAIVATSVVREVARLSTAPAQELATRHGQLANARGAWLFALFLVVNAVLVGWCVRTARRRRAPKV